jgi:predicted RNase H-like HicB family nuclease
MPNIMIIRVQANVPWKVGPGMSGSVWVAVCEPLKLTVQAETWSDLMEDISDTLDAVFSDLLQSNELPQFLKRHGWELMTPLPTKPKDLRFDVPFMPAWMGDNGPKNTVYQ